MSDLFTLNMEHVGSIYGVGEVFVFGLAEHQVSDKQRNLIYLNIAGPTTSVEAVWARLTEGKMETFKPHPRPQSSYLRHHHIRHDRRGIPDKESPFLRFQKRIPVLDFDHLILLDRRFKEVTYNEVGDAFVLEGPQATKQIAEHVRAAVNIAIFPEWYEALVEAGRGERLVKPVASLGHRVTHVVLDRARWEILVTVMLERRELPWPMSQSRNSHRESP